MLRQIVATCKRWKPIRRGENRWKPIRRGENRWKPIRRGENRWKSIRRAQTAQGLLQILLQIASLFKFFAAPCRSVKWKFGGVLSPFNPSSLRQWSSCKCRMASSATKKGIWILWKFLIVGHLSPLGPNETTAGQWGRAKTNDRTERKDSLAHVF